MLCHNRRLEVRCQGQRSKGGEVRAGRRQICAPCLTFEVGVRGEGLGADLAGEGPVGRVELLVFPVDAAEEEGHPEAPPTLD